MSDYQITMVSLDQLVIQNHQCRKFKKVFDFKVIEPFLLSVERDNNYKGFGALRLFKCLLLQLMEDTDNFIFLINLIIKQLENFLTWRMAIFLSIWSLFIPFATEPINDHETVRQTFD